MDSEIFLWVSVTLGVAVIALVILLLMEREKRKPIAEESVQPVRREAWRGEPALARRTITDHTVKEAKDRLRILDLEREIQSYAIRRLYEAGAEGKITAEERDGLTAKYKEDLTRIKEEISRGESVVALNELERMQEEFVTLFSDRFDELNKRIEELRAVSGITPPEPPELEEMREEEEEEEPEKPEAPEQPTAETAPPKTRKKISRLRAPSEPEKTEADKRAEQILAEIEKVLKRLGEMEVE